MADLFSLLSLGANALSAHRSASATASHNLENANTPGYSRQRANLEAVLPAYRLGGAFIGRGVGLNTVSQARDFGAERQWTVANEAQARSRAEADALESLSALDPQGPGALGSTLSDFYASMRALQQNPSDASLRQAALAQAKAVAQAFNRTTDGIEASRDAIDTRMSSQLAEVNTLATQMADLNGQIRIARASGAEPNDLLDARQKTQDRLVELTGARPTPTDDGDVNLSFASGAPLVTGDFAGRLSAVPDATNNGHLALELTRPDGSGPKQVTGVGGAFGGMLAARDGALSTAASKVGVMATDWAAAVNTVHAAGFGLDGVGGRALFVVGPGTTLSVAITDPAQLAAASSAATVPGDASNLQALIGTEGRALSNGLDAFAGWSSLVSGYGAGAQSARATSDADAAIFDHVTGLRESVSGVSIDEEMIELTKAQRGFEAVMKVIQTTDSMLETLMSLKP